MQFCLVPYPNRQIWSAIMVSTSRHITFLLCLLALGLVSCASHKDERAAQAFVDNASSLVQQQRYEAALRQLDSVHALYPKQVAQRRQAKALHDSIVYLQSKQTLAYSDSLLQTLIPQSDELLKAFRYEKADAYEDHGHYVYRSLQTGWNTNRCFLQAYVTDDRQTFVKSYYYGAKQAHQQAVRLEVPAKYGETIPRVELSGENHAFEVEGWHEILTLTDDPALEILNFVSSHVTDKIKVSVIGDKPQAVYFLSDSEKEALDKTYALGLLMRDINRLEQQIRLASKRIEHFETRRQTAD